MIGSISPLHSPQEEGSKSGEDLESMPKMLDESQSKQAHESSLDAGEECKGAFPIINKVVIVDALTELSEGLRVQAEAIVEIKVVVKIQMWLTY